MQGVSSKLCIKLPWKSRLPNCQYKILVIMLFSAQNRKCVKFQKYIVFLVINPLFDFELQGFVLRIYAPLENSGFVTWYTAHTTAYKCMCIFMLFMWYFTLKAIYNCNINADSERFCSNICFLRFFGLVNKAHLAT